jgi:hypothetical protein
MCIHCERLTQARISADAALEHYAETVNKSIDVGQINHAQKQLILAATKYAQARSFMEAGRYMVQ